MNSRVVTMVVVLVGLSFTPALAQFDSGSDGSDGAFNPQSNVTIDLSLAATAPWNTPSPVPGQGVYDPDKWAVVFKYSTIDIPAGVVVQFSNHPSGAPVVWLASDDVTILGTVSVNGSDGVPWPAEPRFSAPGPGGFGGGQTDPTAGQSSSGFGPGAYESIFEGGSYGTSPFGAEYVYGTEEILPLIGGSGGGGGTGIAGGGAGGGAILVASSSDIVFSSSGRIVANGGSGAPYGGSGGSIRLVANAISSPSASNLSAIPGIQNAGYGRIRVEAFTIDVQGSVPPWTSSTPSPVFPPSGSPTLRVVSVNSAPVPTHPLAGILTPDVAIATDQAVTLNIEATGDIPAGTTVRVHIVPEHGDAVRANSTPLVDVGGGLLTATYTTTLPRGKCEIQLRANWTP